MRLDDGLGDGQAEAKPLFVHGCRVAAPAETLENAIELLRRDANAAVVHTHRDLVVQTLDRDIDRAFRVGVARGIVEQNEEKLPEPRGVSAHHGRAWAVLQGDIHQLVGADDAHVATHFLQQIAKIDRLEVEAGGTSALAGNEQKIVDQDRQMLGLLDDALDGALVGGYRLALAAQRDLALSTDNGERRAQLVTDVGEETAPCLVDLAEQFVRLAKFFGALFDFRFEIGVRVLQCLAVSLKVGGHAVEASAEVGELMAAGDVDAVREVAFGKDRRPAQELRQRRAQAAQQKSKQRDGGEDGDRRVDLADAFKPQEKTRCIEVDAQNFGSLIRDGHFDEPVELLIEAALHQFEQVLPSDVGPAAAPELLDLAQLIERLLELALDRCNPIELSGLGRAFSSETTRVSSFLESSFKAARSNSMTLFR